MTGTTTPAATPAGTDTTTTSGADADGIYDFDNMPASEEANDIEHLDADDVAPEIEAKPPAETPAEAEAKAAAATAKAAADEAAKVKLTTPQRTKLEKQRLLDEIAIRDRELETLRAKGPTPAPAAGEDPKAPKEADFNGDFLAFNIAKASYDAAKAAEAAWDAKEKTRIDQHAADKAAEQGRARAAEHLTRVDTAKAVIADFDTVMEGMKGVEVRDDLLSEIMGSKNSAVIAYHFAKNPAELSAINAMTPLETAREIGRLEATLKLPEAKLVTKAPPPLSKQKGNASPTSQEAALSAWMDKKYGKDRK